MADALKLGSIFGTNMVLQRGRPIRLWGTGTPGETVEAVIGSRRGDAIVSDKGEWCLELPEIPAGGPYELLIESAEEIARLSNVLVGDVWVCSGQSNMEWTIANVGPKYAPTPPKTYPTIRLFNVIKTQSTVPQTAFPGRWETATPEAIEGFSAVGFFFGRELEDKLDVPIGLINSSWGGTSAEAWTPSDVLSAEPSLAYLLKNSQEAVVPHVDPGNAGFAKGFANRDLPESDWKPIPLPVMWQATGMMHNGAVWFRKHVNIPARWAQQTLMLSLGAIDDFDVAYFNGSEVGRTGEETPGFWTTPRNYTIPAHFVREGDNVIAVRVFDQWGNGGFAGPHAHMTIAPADSPREAVSIAGEWSCKVELELPQRTTVGGVPATELYNAMIHPMVGLPIAGAIWYQGETNASRGREYQTLLPTMIRAWRNRWHIGNFPFLIVQLANFKQADRVESSGWAELREAQHIVATTEPSCGIACAIDIGESDDVHPRNKLDVGKRLALEALRVAHGDKDAARSPSYRDHQMNGAEVTIRFSHTGGGLKSDGPVKGVYVAGEDRVFHPADARIIGEALVVHSQAVQHPVSVRYAWKGDPENSLRGVKTGLPVFPFRTDTWS